jgi:hypothetical protein
MTTLIRQGDILIGKNGTYHIKKKKSGALYLYQEIPIRRYISGLLPRPDLGAQAYQLDIKNAQGVRKYFTLVLDGEKAVMKQFPRYNNRNCLQKM